MSNGVIHKETQQLSPSLNWEYRDVCERPRSSNFADEYALVGERIFPILLAAKDSVAASCRPVTIESAQSGVRILCRAIGAVPVSTEDLGAYYEATLRYIDSQDWMPATRQNACRIVNKILTQRARALGLELRFRNPYPKGKTHIPAPPDDELRSFRLAVREHALRYNYDFLNRDKSEYADLLAEADLLRYENGGLIPPVEDKRAYRLTGRLYRRTAKTGKWRYWELLRRFYPVPASIMPFVILLIDALAANVDAIASIRVDAMTKKNDVLRGPIYRIDLEKPRASGPISYAVRDHGPLSVPWIINFLIAYTEPIRHLAPVPQQKFLLLMKTDNDPTPKALPAAIPYQAYKAYRRCHNLPNTVHLNSLRPANALEEYEKTYDPLRVKRKLKHESLDTSIRYVEDRRAISLDEIAIANAQDSFGKPTEKMQIDAPSKVHLPSHDCLDPSTGHGEKGLDGICSSLLWPLDDQNFIMDYNDRSVAFLLRDYYALIEARMRLPDARFSAGYASRLALIEDVYMPVIRGNKELMDRAHAILAQLPPVVPFS